MNPPIKIVDLFAGPGGLGEGFSSFSRSGNGRGTDRPYRIMLSAEKDRIAHQTLRLRAFYRQFSDPAKVPDLYYRYIAGLQPFDLEGEKKDVRMAWEKAEAEARCLTLGDEADNALLDRRIRDQLGSGEPWILIGGPPCQAYSLVGRARNSGITGYRPEADHRHFLYREYLRIIRRFRPTVFVMENVKGILSASIKGKKLFGQILEDLQDPVMAETGRRGRKNQSYRIYSLSTGRVISRDNPDHDVDPREFIVRAEEHGVPQRRHRVFLIGIREDVEVSSEVRLSKSTAGKVTVQQVIGDLPKLRSGLSGKATAGSGDSWDNWKSAIISRGGGICERLRRQGNRGPSGSGYDATADVLERAMKQLSSLNHPLSRCEHCAANGFYGPDFAKRMPDGLAGWFRDRRLLTVASHDTRAHIKGDLDRYLFCSAWGAAGGVSPKSHDFPKFLAPRHENWGSGKFADRFRVQLASEPATTITSHISKDGHYFIHYDPMQCRSLTVREAARIQTFPDNYFFEGGRTQQYVQVGNAVPPFLARQIAAVIWKAVFEKGPGK